MTQVRSLFLISIWAALVAACNSDPSAPPVSSTNAALTADVESSGSSGGVAGGELIPVNDVVLTSDPGDPDALVQNLALTGQANITGTFRASDFARVVESCVLYDASTAVSAPVMPDASGRMSFTGLPLVVPAMGEVRVGVRCDFDSALDNPSGELVTVGIADALDIEARGMDMGVVPVTVTMTAMREAGATGEAPMLGIPVEAAGDIVVEFDPAGPAGIVVPDGSLAILASGTITATGEDIVLEQAGISLAGDAAAYDDIAVFIGGEQVGTAVAGSGIDSTVDVTITGGMSILRRDVSQSLELRARLATLAPRSSVGASLGTPVSGNRVALGFASASGTGATSASPCALASVVEGNTLVVRGSELAVSIEEITTSMLYRGRAFPAFRATVTGTGELARLVLVFDRTMTPEYAMFPAGYSFYGITVFRDGAPVDTATIHAEDGTDLRSMVYPFPAMDMARAIVSFPGGLAVDGSTTIEVHLSLTGEINANDVLSIGLADSTATDTATGYLSDDAVGSVGPVPATTLDEGTDLGPGGASTPFVIAWSDRTDSPHNASTAGSGGSRDWINEFGLGDLSLRNVIAAP